MAMRTRGRTEKGAKVWDEGKECPPRFDFGSQRFSRSRVRRLLTRGCLSPSTTDNGLQVSINAIYTHSTLTLDNSSTNARFIESLDIKYKPSVDRVHESRRDASDDEDEDALFAKLEAELEDADSATLRDRGIKEMQAQLRRFPYLQSLAAQLTGTRAHGVGWKKSKPCSRLGMDNTQKSQTRKRSSERVRKSTLDLPSIHPRDCAQKSTQQ